MRDVLGYLKAALLGLVIVTHAVLLVLAVVFLFDSGALPGATVLLAELGLERQHESILMQPTIMEVDSIDRNLAVRTQVIVTCQAVLAASNLPVSPDNLGVCWWDVSTQVCAQVWPEGSEPYQGCVFGKPPEAGGGL
jgi:hypothetical protein